MKRFLLTLLAVMAFAGMSVAQDVYYSGYYTNSSGRKVAAVYKNNTKLYESSGATFDSESTGVVFADNHVFWSQTTTNLDGYYGFADIYKDGNVWLNSPANEYRHINGMCTSTSGAYIYAAGSMVTNGVQRAVVWRAMSWDDYCSTTPYYTMGNTSYDSEALACCYLDNHLWVVGIQYMSEGNDSFRGVVWKDGEEFCNLGTGIRPEGIDGNRVLNELDIIAADFNHDYDTYTYIEVWDLINGQFNPNVAGMPTDATQGCICNDYGLRCWGQKAQNQLMVFENWGLVYSHPISSSVNNGITAIEANDNGVYYAGQLNNQGKVWKDGSVLYSPSNCQCILDLYMVDPTCSQSSYNLPFEEDFEYGTTHWICWTIGNFWEKDFGYYGTGSLSASFSNTGTDGDYWLKSPQIVIPSGSGTTTLTFDSRIHLFSGTYPSGGCSVWISTSTPNSFSNQLWAATSATDNVETITIDLSAYNGQSVYLGFKYNRGTASPRFRWSVDNVSVTQSAPTQYTITANASPTSGGTVSGGGTYNQGATCTLTATPASGYEFLYWKKGNTQVSTNATYSFTVTESATYTAYFQQAAPTQYTITVNANNNAWGTVSGGGQYNAGATCTLHATPASGYQFDSWKKNGSVVSTNPNYSFTVTENATYTAYFSAEPVTYYTITVNASPSNGGTVTGGGTYPAGSSVTLTATPNNGYAFSQWQDGSTANPRTITVNGDATYTATFTQLQYTITTSVSPAGAGTVTGGGAYHYGEQVTLTATANSGYEFQGWNDGVTNNPRTITVTGNATYTAIFSEVGATYYNVTTSVSPAGAGTVTGGGTYEAGSVIVLTATANPGYTFNRWDDSSTQNPRTVTVNSDLSFTAIFTQNQYTITVVANPSNAGTVSGGGAYHYGEYATLTATAYSGYEFVGWSDGSSQNPHQVMVTGNATYTATFTQSGTTYYTVSAYISPAGAGTVSGTGTFPAGATTTLTATANNGYTFDHWNDGSTTNPRTVTVNNNMSFTAYFNANQYTITTNVAPAGAGTVTGGGTYPYGATATLTATANTGYEFLQWSDGNLQNPRTFTVTQNATYTALFSNGSGSMYTLTVRPSSPFLGETYGSGTYPAGSAVEISAFPTPYSYFQKWNDGNTENPRTVIVNSNMEFIAEFGGLSFYTITVESANPERGEAFGGGSYREGTEVEIAAVAYEGYMFEKWTDGNTQNPRTITVTGDATYTARFVESSVTTYVLNVVCNTEQGTVSGGGTYVAGTTATIQAFPNPGYTFSNWSDGNTDNPRTITMNSDLTLVAFFGTGVGENDGTTITLYPNPAKESIRILGIEANSQVEIYNSLGELVKVLSVGPDQEIGIRDLASGLYLLRCGNAALRFVKQQ